MNWKPLSENDLLVLIELAEAAMELNVKRLWGRIRIQPEKWQLSPWGNLGGGFWVVAVMGQKCLWYNDIEEGFNFTQFKSFGIIGEYGCNQTELHPFLHDFFSQLSRELNKFPE